MKGKKTLGAAALLGLAGWLLQFLGGPEMAMWLADHPGPAATGVAILMAVLRVATTGPVIGGEK